MSDDIIARLRCAYRAASEFPCEACTFCAARAEIERLRAVLDVIDAQHQPYLSAPACQECQQHWPCGTHLLIHPEEARRG